MTGAAALAFAQAGSAADAADLKAIQAEIDKHHDEAVQRLQHWIQPAVHRRRKSRHDRRLRPDDAHAARCRDSRAVTKVPTDGHPGVFATLDAGAPRTVGIYFMYDVKQADPSEWSSPPFEAAPGGSRRAWASF